METITKPAGQIAVGDWVDLEGDAIADPMRDNWRFECEYVEVDHVEHETPDCVCIGFEGFDHVGFPPGHCLRVAVKPAGAVL